MDTSIMVCLVLLFTFAASVVAMNSTGDACGVCECIEHLHAVICTGKGLRELPSGIPNDTVSLELGDNFLHEIPYDSLLEFKSLIKINLTNNLIEKPFGLPESVKFLHAEGNRLQDIKPIVKNGIHLHSVNFRENNLEVLETGTFKKSTDLIHLDLGHNKISEMQPEALEGPRNIYNLTLDHNTLEELGPDNTRGLQFTALWMNVNNLKVLRPHTFGSVWKLCFMTLANCKLEEIPPGLFLSQTKQDTRDKHINFLRLSENKLQRVSPGAFHGVKSFRNLYLDRNELTSLPSNMFENLTEIGVIEFAHNRLVSEGLPEDTFQNTSILTLDISSNQLTFIPTGLFRSQTGLRNLYLQRNRISVLQEEVFRGLRSLRFLMLFDNPITELVDWLFYDTKLTRLYLFQSQLSSLGERSFATRNKTLDYISLYGNNLRRIPDTVWQDLGRDSYVAIENILEFAPVTNRNDVKIELVGNGFAQQIIVTRDLAEIFNQSGFNCRWHQKGYWECTPCPQGTFGTSRTNSCCIACPPGGFYQIKTGQVANASQGINCQRCNNGTYVTPEAHPGTSPANCTVCPTGTNKSLHAGFRACPCLDNFFRTDRFGECQLCPNEGVNCSGEYQHLLPGFWWTWDWVRADNYQSYQQFVQNVLTETNEYDNETTRFLGVLPKVHRCPRSESCVNAEMGGINVTCAEGYTGWLCAQCSPSFYSWFDHCFKCPEWWWFLLEVLLLLTVIALIVIVTAWQIRKGRKKGRSPVSVLLARGKILLGFYQVTGEIFSALEEISWPRILTSVGSLFRLLEVNIMQLIISPRCYFPRFTYPEIYIELLVGTSFVALVMFAACCYYSLTKCYLKTRNMPVEKRTGLVAKTKQRCYLFVVILLFVSYPSLSSVILTLLPSGCQLFYVNDDHSVSVTRLRADYSIDCRTQQHVSYNHAAEVALSYVVGFPLVLLLLLWWTNRKRAKGIPGILLESEDVVQSTRDECGRRESEDRPLLDVAGGAHSLNASRVGESHEASDQTDDDEPLLHLEPSSQDEFIWESFLCENYKPQFWYWEILELARKIVQTLFVLLYGPNDHFTMFATIVISVGFLLLHAYVKPMKDAAEHRLQMCSLGTILLNLLAASLLLLPSEHSQSGEERKEILSVILVCLNLSIIVFVVVSLLWTGAKALWRQGCRCRHGGCIATVCASCCHRPSQRRSEWYHFLDDTEQDFSADVQIEYPE